jgi:hypothetical protein
MVNQSLKFSEGDQMWLRQGCVAYRNHRLFT